MFTADRNQIHAFLRETWRKYRAAEPLSPLETIISDVAAAHPEYHHLLADPDPEPTGDGSATAGQANGFLHMGLHIALREQLAANRPSELRPTYRRLLAKTGDAHAAEHQIIECIGKLLSDSAQNGKPVDERQYAECLQRLR